MRKNQIYTFKLQKIIFFSVLFTFLSVICISCAGTAASAEEYYSIGMAYFDLGKFEDAEKWLNRAKQANRTMVASTYNLGRIAFENKRYDEAARLFENILRRDSDNVPALRAAAYTRIRMGDIEKAENHYSKLLILVPESADNGYNHSLVLYAMKRYGDAEAILEKYPYSLRDNYDMLLLYARSQKAQNKIEAIDNYSTWLNNSSDARIRYEYAQALEYHELYARALEEYQKTLTEIEGDAEPKKSDVRFATARVLLIAESASPLGITELETAVREGFNDIEAVEELLISRSISGVNSNSIRNIVNNMRRTAAEIEAAAAAERAAQELAEEQEILEDNSQSGS